jgi:hypothetical protein
MAMDQAFCFAIVIAPPMDWRRLTDTFPHLLRQVNLKPYISRRIFSGNIRSKTMESAINQ